MPVDKQYKTVVLYNSPVPYYTLVQALSNEVIASRYDKMTTVQYYVMDANVVDNVLEMLDKIGVTRHNWAVFNSNGTDYGIKMGISGVVLKGEKPEEAKPNLGHLNVVKPSKLKH